MKSSNPILNEGILSDEHVLTGSVMTVSGTMNKLLILSLIMIAGAAAVFYQFSLNHFDFVNIIMKLGIGVSFIIALVLFFKRDLTPILAPVYAFSQGAVLSGISCFFEKEMPGIVSQAISMTLIVVFTMAFLFKTGVVQATARFRSTLIIATVSVFIFYLISILLMSFGVNVPYFTSNSNINILLNVAFALIAAFNLILDFDFIEKGANAPLPAYYEWYGAFGLLVTILWIYVEILRLLSRFNRR